MMTQKLLCLAAASVLACSGSSIHLPVDAPAADTRSPAVSIDSADGLPSRILDGGVDRQPWSVVDLAAPDTRPAVDAAPADATPGETPGAMDALPAVDGTRVDTRDTLVDSLLDTALDAAGREAGVDGDPGLPFCTSPAPPTTIVLEAPAGRITVGTVYGDDPTDVWVTTLPDHKVARWNGSTWTWVAELADVPILTIAGSSSSDVWLGGTGGALWHWDGAMLSPTNSKTTKDIQQLAVLASGQAFALAFAPVHDSTFDLIRLAGTEWLVVGQPSAPLEMYHLPHELYAPTADEAWVATCDQVFHYQLDAFTTVAVPDAVTVWGTSPSNVWFGEYKWDGQQIVKPLEDYSGSAIWGTGPSDMWIGATHWDGQTATKLTIGPWYVYPSAIGGLSASDVWATNQYGGVYHFDGTQTWSEVVAEPDTSSTHLYGLANGLWQLGANALWITGPYNQIYLYQGDDLSPIPQTGTPPTDDLFGVWGSNPLELWAVGDNGAILQRNGTTWTRAASPTTSTLRAVSGSAADDVWAVGDAGTVLHWNGATWAPVVANTAAGLYGVWATAGYVVAVGTNGTIIANDGSGFVAQPSGTTTTLRGVWGRSPADVYAADGQNLFIYDGKAWTAKAIASRDTCVSGVWGASDGVFVNGYYYDGTEAQRLAPAYPLPTHNSGVYCTRLDGVWAGSATDIWSVGSDVQLLSISDPPKQIYHFNAECIETVASNLYDSIYECLPAGPCPAMRAIFGLGEHDLWAVGDSGMIAHILR